MYCGSKPHRYIPIERSLSQLERFLLRSPESTWRRICHLLTKPELGRLGQTSNVLSEYVSIYTQEAWDINDFLGTWFSDPCVFRSALAYAGAVITGSQALRYLDRLHPSNSSDLDIVTRLGGAMTLCLYLQEQGYTRVARTFDRLDDYPLVTDLLSMASSKRFCSGGGSHGILGIFDFVKPHFQRRLEDLPNLKVQVIVVTQNPIEHIVLTYHSTLVMNYITHREAVSVFPASTFLDRVGYVSSRKKLGPGWDATWKRKYESRGFRFDTKSLHPKLQFGNRSTSDSLCWRVSFDDVDEDSLIALEESRGVYGPEIFDPVRFEMSWITDPDASTAELRFRVGVYEPEIWDYLFPWHLLQ
ncbi:hypothetical protein DFP72DRAFT_306623 [Ephemerocybe angulata]|uniref:Uncharacterized protein n=1 Tax=Ephemerocybe angulata TaxID=980116 RepID=A0A8H6M9E8_9AGAR|nr:hypothetical protein DFP72DRAFT_306623 [Tulosesus angulatus]